MRHPDRWRGATFTITRTVATRRHAETDSRVAVLRRCRSLVSS